MTEQEAIYYVAHREDPARKKHSVEGKAEGKSRIVCRVRLVRQSRGWTMEELAVRAGTSKSHLQRVERGEREPGVLMALRLAAALDRTVSELWPLSAPGEQELDLGI